MTHEKLKSIAYGAGTKKADGKKMEKGKKAVSNVLSIDKKFIAEFAKTASNEDYEWIRRRSAQLMLEKKAAYFPAFRVEFAKRFFPEMLTGRHKRTAEPFLDMLERVRAGA